MDITQTKTVVMVLLGAIKLGSGLAPMLLTKMLKKKNEWIMKKFIGSILCFGGGVLLSTVFIHLLSEVRESLEMASSEGVFIEDTNFPFAELFICAGFLLIHLIETVVHKIFGHSSHSHAPFTEPQQNSLTSLEDVGVKIPRCGLVNRGFVNDDPSNKYYIQSQGISKEESSEKSVTKLNERGIIVSVRSFLVVLALSVHSIFEGMAIGLEESKSGVWSLFLAVAIHSAAIVFCIGTEMLSSGLKKIQILIYLTVLSLVTPFGVLLGIVVTVYLRDGGGEHLLVVGVLQGLAGGTLLYITFFEVLAKDNLAKYGMSGLFGALMIMIGFTAMASMQAGLGHSHTHQGGHEGHHHDSPNTYHDKHHHKPHEEISGSNNLDILIRAGGMDKEPFTDQYGTIKGKSGGDSKGDKYQTGRRNQPLQFNPEERIESNSETKHYNGENHSHSFHGEQHHDHDHHYHDNHDHDHQSKDYHDPKHHES